MGIAHEVAGEADLLTYLVFLIVASRLYDSMSLALQNLAATFNAKLQIERMRQIEEQPIHRGRSLQSQQVRHRL